MTGSKKYLSPGESVEKSIFCSRVKMRRLELGLTGAQLGEKIGFDHSQIYHMEAGRFPRDEKRIAAIADALGVSLDWLFGRNEAP